MVKTIQARDISLYELEEKFGLQVIEDTEFFCEWTENLPNLTDGEKQAMSQTSRFASTHECKAIIST